MVARKPKVSVVCLTYNHEEYIEQALESFLMQQGNFDMEILIADDASTDDTQKIIKKYMKKYPGRIRATLRKKNIGVGHNLKDVLAKVNGDYVAACEGDDYWTDPNKLKLQVEYLDKHSDYAVCFHTTRVIYEDGEREEYQIPQEKTTFTLEKLISGNYIHTSSVMYRKDSYDNLPTNMLPIDWYLHLQHAKLGKIGFIDKTMSVYRRNKNSVWFPEQGKADEFWLTKGVGHAVMFEAVHDLFKGTKYLPLVERVQNNWTQHLVDLDMRYKAGLMKDLCDQVPLAISRYVERNVNDLQQTKQELDIKNEQLELMKRSVFWRLRNGVAKLVGKSVI